MSYKLRTIRSFDRDVKRLARHYHSLRDDLRQLARQLLENPLQGADLGGGIRKIRLAITSKQSGKRGGARVIIHIELLTGMHEGTICFLALYDKSAQSSISDKIIRELLKEAGII